MRHGLERSTAYPTYSRAKIYSGQVVPRASLVVVSKIVTAAAAADAKSGFFVVIVFLPPPLDACLKYISSPPLPFQKNAKTAASLVRPTRTGKGKKSFCPKAKVFGYIYIYARIISIQGQTLPSSQQHMLPLKKKTGASAGQKPKKIPGL